MSAGAAQRAGLRRQIEALPGLIRDSHEDLEDRARHILSTPEHLGLQNVVLTGCGDSFIAARAAAFAFDELAGLPAASMEAMSVARYLQPGDERWRPGGQLLLAISSSGGVARAVEAARRFAPKTGTIVCATTANDVSALARASDRTLSTAAEHQSEGPGLCSFVLSVLALLHLAIRSGEVRGRCTMDEAARLRRELAETADLVDAAIESAAAPLADVARRWEAHAAVELLSSGPARASAAFGAAKIVEAVGLSAMDQDIEEFMHLQYFEQASRNIATVLLCNPGFAAGERAEEVRRCIGTLERPLLVFTDAAEASAQAVTYPRTRELFAPIVHAALLAMLSAELADVHDAVPGRGGTGRWRDSRDGAAVRHVEGAEAGKRA
jgi:glutamine---fructose-6-phosphate transaminase (isomerizing)